MRLPRALHRNAIRQVINPLSVFVEHLVLLGAKPAGGKAIDRDSMFAPVIGQTHSQLADAAAARAIRAQASKSGDAGDRTNIDDPAVTTRHHPPRDSLSDKETAA